MIVLVWVLSILLVLIFIFLITKTILYGLAIDYSVTNNLYQTNLLPVTTSIPFLFDQYQTHDFKTFSPATALFCIELINNVYYATHEKYLILPPTFSLMDSLYDPFSKNNIGYILKENDDGKIWIVFRGTIDLSDVFHDLESLQVPFNKNSNTILVQSGYFKIYQSFRSVIQSLSTNQQIIIIGHSLGGALAMLSLMDLITKYPDTLVYTFGAPRVGNPKFSQYLENHDAIVYRVENTSDIVPYFPLPITLRPLAPHSPFFYNHFGSSFQFTDNRQSYYQNHDTMTYYENILFKHNENISHPHAIEFQSTW